MAENAGTIYAEIRIDIDGLKKEAMAAQKAIKEIETKANKSGAAAGTQYVKGFGKGQVELNQKLNDFVSTMQGVSPKMGQIGVKMASMFSKPIFAMVPVVSAAFQAMLPVIGTIVVAVAALIKGISKAAGAQKEFNDNVELSGKASDILNQKTTELNKEQQKSADIAARQERNAATMGLAFKKLGDFFSDTFLPIINAVRDGFTAIGDAVTWVANKLGIVNKEEADAAANAQRLVVQNEALTEAQKRYKTELEDIAVLERTRTKTEDEISKSRLSAVEEYLKSLIRLRNETAAIAGEQSKATKEYDDKIKTLLEDNKELYAEQKKQTEGPKAQVKETNLLTQAREAYRATLAQIKNQEDAYFIDTSEAMSQRLAAEQQYVKTLSGLRTEYKQLGNVTEEQLAHISAEEAAHIANAKALQTVIDYQKQYTAETARLKADYEQISAEMGNETTLASLMATEAEKRAAALEKQRDAELAALKTRYDAIAASRESGELTQDEINHRDMLTDAINKNYDALRQLSDTEAVTAAQQDILEYGKEIRNQYQGILKDITGEEAIQNRLVALALEQTNQQKAQKTLNDLNREAALEEVEKYFDKIAAQRESGQLTAEETAERERLTAAIDQNYEAVKRLENQQAVTATLEEISASGKKIDEQYKDITRQLAEQEILRDKSLTDYEKEVALNDMRREASLEELDAQFDKLKAQRESGELTAEEIALYDQLKGKINLTYDAAKSGIKEAKEEAIDYKKVALQIAEASVSAFTDITSAISTIAQQNAQAAMEAIDKTLEETKKKIEEAREAQLVAEGFMEARRAEDMQAQIDAAREANDQVLQYQLERRQREMEINEQYDAEVKAAEEQANKEKAEEEYKAAQTKYEIDLTNAIVAGALAITNAVASGMGMGPLAPVMTPILVGTATAATAATAAQIAVIAANPPKLKFATGGIVPGQPHSNTDTVAGWLTPGEVILNRAQQETLAPQLRGGGGDIYIDLIYNGERVSKMVIEDYVNKGRILIDASRGIR